MGSGGVGVRARGYSEGGGEREGGGEGRVEGKARQQGRLLVVAHVLATRPCSSSQNAAG